MDGSERWRFVDKTGAWFELCSCGCDDGACLLDMYLGFTPKKAHQGLPPEDPEACRGWIEGLLGCGRNYIVRDGDTVVGHAALLPDLERKDAEYIIFVDEPFRGRGLGTELTAAALREAERLGLRLVWLTVEGHNFRAIRLYRKYGFVFTGDGGWERMMTLEL